MTSMPPTEAQPTEPPRPRGKRWPWFVVFCATVVVALLVVIWVTARREGSETPPTTTTTSLAVTTSAPTTSSTTSTTVPPPADFTTAVWPSVSGRVRYSDPVAAARGFAVDFVGFTNPALGAFRPGDARSGEVDVRGAGGLVTTVLVRELGTNGTWWVLGAGTPEIELRLPAARSAISSPVHLQGSSRAFEGTVQTEVRQDGDAKPLGSGFVTGGAGSELGSFDGMLAFSHPSVAWGAVVLRTDSSENGQVAAATVVRIRFAP